MTGHIINSGKVKVHTNYKRLAHSVATPNTYNCVSIKKTVTRRNVTKAEWIINYSLVFELLRSATFHNLVLSFNKLNFYKLCYLLTL